MQTQLFFIIFILFKHLSLQKEQFIKSQMYKQRYKIQKQKWTVWMCARNFIISHPFTVSGEKLTLFKHSSIRDINTISFLASVLTADAAATATSCSPPLASLPLKMF